MLSLLLITSYAGTISDSCGKSVKFSLNTDNGSLAISGSGPMANYIYYSLAPWAQYSDCIIYTVIDGGVTTIGEYAFYQCTKMKSIIIPDSVSFIGKNAFFCCLNLSFVNIPEGISSIEEFSFSGCNILESITIPESVKTIKESAFDFAGLTSICIPENVTYIDFPVFKGCTNMISINVSANNKAFKSEEGVIFNYVKKRLLCCPSGKTNRYFIPFGVEEIGNFAFSCCEYLSSITFPTSISKIGLNAFEFCDGLTSIIIPINSLSAAAFNSCSNLSSVTYLGDTDIKNHDDIFNYCNNLTEIHVLTSYGSGDTFCGFRVHKCVYTASCGTSLSYIFDKCTSALTIYGVGNMDNYTNDPVPWISFKDSMNSVVISYGVGFIGNNAFSNCTELSSITIPSSVKSIGDYAFSKCSNLVSVIYNGANDPGNDSNAFDECDKLIKVIVPANYIGNTFCGKNIFRMQTVTNANTVIIATTVSVAAILVIAGITVVICFHKKSSSKYEDENVQV